MSEIPEAVVGWAIGKVSATLSARLSGGQGLRARASRPRDFAREPTPGSSDRAGGQAPTGPEEGQAGGRLQGVARWAKRAHYRFRKALVPIWVLPLLVAIPEVGPRLDLGVGLPLAVGAGLTIFGAAWVDRRERVYAATVIGGATLWASAAWLLGIRAPLLALLVALWLPASVIWWRHQRVRSRVVIHELPVRLLPEGWLGRCRRQSLPRTVLDLWRHVRAEGRGWWVEQLYRRRSRRFLRHILSDWRRTASAADVPGCRIRRAEDDRVAYTLHVQLRKGQTHSAMLRHLEAIGSSLAANTGTLRIELERGMDRVRIRWVHRDPLAGAGVVWPFELAPEVQSATEPFTLGPNEHGEGMRICLADGVDTLVVGIKGSGKSVLLNGVLAAVAGMHDAVLWGIDPAGEVEFGPWEATFDRLAGTSASTAALLDALERVVQVRLGMLRRAGIRNWDPRLGPYVVLAIDELKQLKPSHREQLSAIVQLCRKTGVRIIAATTHPAAEDTNSGLRSQLDRVICLRLKSTDAIRMAFGRDMLSAGWDPTTQLHTPGSFLIYDPAAHLTPIVARAYWITDAVVAEVAARLAPIRPTLDAESARAAQEPEATSAPAAAPEPRVAPAPKSGEPLALRLVPPRKFSRASVDAEARLNLLERAIRRAGRPISGRLAAKLADVPNSWAADTGLPELQRRGQVVLTESKEWRAVEEAAVSPQ